MHVSFRAIAVAVAVAVFTSIFGLVAAPLLSLAPPGVALAQEGTKIEIELDPVGMVVEGTEIDFTLTFSGVNSTGTTYMVNVVRGGNQDATECEGEGAFTDMTAITAVNGTATTTGTISNTCPAGYSILVASLYDSNRDEITSTAVGFLISGVQSWDLKSASTTPYGEDLPTLGSPTGLMGSYETYNGNGVTRFSVVDSTNRKIHVYDLEGYTFSFSPGNDDGIKSLAYKESYDIASTTSPWGISNNGIDGITRVVSAGTSTNQVLAYRGHNLSERASDEEFTLHPDNADPKGMYFGSGFYVADDSANKIFGYERWNGTTTYDSDRDYDLGELNPKNTDITGIWLSGAVMWVADTADDKLYAYNMYRDKDYMPEWDVSGITDNPSGIWSNYTWMYVLDSTEKTIYAYSLPNKYNARLPVSGPTYVKYEENGTDKVASYTAETPENYLSWSLVSTGDHQHFQINNGHLYFNSPPDFEHPNDDNGDNVYELVIEVSITQTHAYQPLKVSHYPVKVEVTDVVGEQPFFTKNSTTRTVDENTPAGTNIGEPVTAVNPDADETHVYSLTGDDAASFDFSTSTGQIITKAALDYETKDSYSVRVGIRDNEDESGTTTTSTADDDSIAVTIVVTDVDEGPEVDGPRSPNHPENTVRVAQYTGTDPNSRPITWSLSGNDAGKFSISATGTLSFKSPPDYETPIDKDRNNDYYVTITVSAGSDTGSLVVVVFVSDVNEAPTFSNSQESRSVAENTPAGENVGAPVTAIDVDDNDTLTYELGGNDASDFDIDPSSGQIQTSAQLDHETKPSYRIKVIASDSYNATSSVGVVISVTDANDQPEFSDATTDRSVVEHSNNAPVGAPITAIDQDGNSLHYKLTGGATSTFSINSGTGQLTSLVALDSETQSTYFVTVSVRDNKDDQGSVDSAEDDSITVNITVTDGNDAPLFPGATTTREVSENTPAGQHVDAPVDATDPDDRNLTYSLIGTDARHFDIATSTGQILTKSELDYESSKKSYTVIVQVTDGRDVEGAADSVIDDTIEVTINILDVNEAPEITGHSSRDWPENVTGTIATYTAVDPESATITWSVDGADKSHFGITEGGALSINTVADYEDPVDVGRDNAYQIVVLATTDDGGAIGRHDVTVNVTNVNEAPVVTGVSAVDYPENSTSTVENYRATDPDGATTTFSWSTSGTHGSAFNVEDGVLTFKSPPDYENQQSYTVRVQANDGGTTGHFDITVNITNVEEAGTVTLSKSQPRVESPLNATLRDPDGSVSEVTWTWESATSTDSWATISGATSTSYTPDEADVGKFIRATASYTDPEGSGKLASGTSANQVLEKLVINVAPEYRSSETREVPENSQPNSEIGSPLTANDDNNDDLTYELGGTDASSFDIATSTGQLLTKDQLDHEDKPTYTVTVTATDPSNEEATVTVTIKVTDVDEPPEFTSGPTSVSYPETDTGTVATYTAIDPEGEQVVWDLSGADGTRFRILGGELNFTAQPDYDDPQDEDGDNEYHVTVVAQVEGSNAPATRPVIVTVTPRNEPPQFPSSDTRIRSVTENTGAGQNVGAPVRANDPENDELTYTLGGTDARHFDIVTSTGQILAKSELNYEGKRSYSVTVSVTDNKNADDSSNSAIDDRIDITIKVINVNESPEISGATSTNFAENGTRSVATFTGRDPEGGSVTWTLHGTDSAYFAISNNGVLSFDRTPDYEDPRDSGRNNVYHVTVQASDSNYINHLDVTVTVTNVEEAGTVSLSSVQPQVDTPLTATLNDPDEVVSDITWSWQSSTRSNGGWSTISGATSDSYTASSTDVGRYLRATASYDDGYSNGKSASAVSANTVRAVPAGPNTPPNFGSNSQSRSVQENSPRGTDIGAPVTASDDDRLTYRLNGTDGAMFSIVASTGQIQTRMPLDYEANTRYSVTVKALDPSSASSTIPVTISVTDEDEPPITVDDSATASEDGSAVSVDVLANDRDPEGRSLTLQSVTQPSNGSAVVENGQASYTPNPGYYGSDHFTYTVSDGALSSVGNVNVRVASTGDPTVQIAEIPIQFVPIDDGGERILLSDYFSDPDSGYPPYQATSSDPTIMTVEVSDGYLSITPVGIGVATTTLTVSDTPTINQQFRVVVYRPVVPRTDTETVHIVDPDAETTLTSSNGRLSVTFQAGSRDQFFQAAIDAQSNNCGVEAPVGHQHVCVLVDLFDLGAESIEENLNLSSTMRVTLDQTLYSAIQAAVAAGEFKMWKGHGPTDVSWEQIQECPDPRGTDECYELTSNGNGEGGKITVYNIMGFSEFAAGNDLPVPPSTVPPVTTPPTEPPTATPPPSTGGGSSSGGGSGNSGYSQHHSTEYEYVGNQTPQIFGQIEVTYAENDTAPVAEYTARDADGDDVTWSLLGYDRRKFEISSDGTLSFRSPPDYENPEGREGNTYWVILQAEDDGRPSEYDVHNVRVTVTQVNELGEIHGDSDLTLPENNAEAVAQYRIEDPENGTITWTLSGSDADAFRIDEQGSLSPAVSMDFESTTSSEGSSVHTLTVTATDDGRPELSAQMDVSITLTNVNEAPQVDSIPGVALTTEDPPWLIDLGMYFADPDGDPLAYEISGKQITDVALAHLQGATLSIDPVSEGEISFYVVATDSEGMRAVTSVAISVTEPEPVPAPVVAAPVPVKTPTPAVPEPVIVAPEPETYAPLPPLVEKTIRNQTQESDSISKVIVGFALEPVTQPAAEVVLPPAAGREAPQKISPIHDVAAGDSQSPLLASLDPSEGGLTMWLIIMLMLIAMIPGGYAVRMYVIHRL